MSFKSELKMNTKHILFFTVISFPFICCNNEVKRETRNEAKNEVNVSEKNISQEKLVPDLRAFGKDLCSGKIQPSDDINTLTCLDSLSNKNAETRQFFSKIVACLLEKSDGALSEVLGVDLEHFLKEYPTDFIIFYKNLSTKNQKIVIELLAFEFCMNIETDDKKQFFNKYFQEKAYQNVDFEEFREKLLDTFVSKNCD